MSNELKAYIGADPTDRTPTEYYLKSEVDKVLAEKDKEIAELKAKLEDAKASHYAEMVDAGMRERRLRRALLLVCAKRADAEAHIENNLADLLLKGQTLSAVDFHRLERDKWYKRAVSCRAKAEEYR